MTEEQQAQMLAQWLEDPSSPPPEGLDPEVIEALGVLRPDWVPHARVTAEEVLESIATDAPVIDLKRARAARIPGWQLIGGLSGAGAMAAAAIALFALFPASSWKTENVQRSAPVVALEAATLEDHTEPHAEPQEALAVDDDVGDENRKDLGPAPAPPAPEPRSKAKLARAPAPPKNEAPAADVAILTARSTPKSSAPSPEAGGVLSGGIGAPMPAQMEATRPPPSTRTRMGTTAKRKVMSGAIEEESFAAMAPEAEADEPLPLDTLRSKVLVHLGPMPEAREGASPEAVWIANAKNALDAGHHELAEQHALHGLSLGTGPTAERRWLTFLVGEARRMRGDDEAARMRFEAALRGEVD